MPKRSSEFAAALFKMLQEGRQLFLEEAPRDQTSSQLSVKYIMQIEEFFFFILLLFFAKP